MPRAKQDKKNLTERILFIISYFKCALHIFSWFQDCKPCLGKVGISSDILNINESNSVSATVSLN